MKFLLKGCHEEFGYFGDFLIIFHFILSLSHLFIHGVIQDNTKHISWPSTLFMDTHSSITKRILELNSYLPNTTYQPWFIRGDLNEFSNPEEKLAISNDNSTRYNRFINFIHSDNLFDMGSIYIHLHGVINVKMRMPFMLDWILLQLIIFVTLYSNAILANFSIFGSGHGPIFLNLASSIL